MNIFTFPLFSKLPKELRDMIWDSALRPLEHGVHYFSVEESSSTGPVSQYAQRGVELCSTESDANLSTYMLTRGLLTACKESRAAVERSRRYAQNTPRIITSKLDGRVQELFYCDSSDIIILRIGWGRTGHIVSDCLAIPESNKGHIGAPPHFPKHIGLEIDYHDLVSLVQWETQTITHGQQYEHLRCFVDSMRNWVNHGATLHFICRDDEIDDLVYNRRVRVMKLESCQIEGPVFYDSKFKYLPVAPLLYPEAYLVAGIFIQKLETVFRNTSELEPCGELFPSLKALARQQISPDRTM